MTDNKDVFDLNCVKKLITFVMCGDWRDKTSTIIKINNLPENRISQVTILFDDETTTITFTIR